MIIRHLQILLWKSTRVDFLISIRNIRNNFSPLKWVVLRIYVDSQFQAPLCENLQESGQPSCPIPLEKPSKETKGEAFQSWVPHFTVHQRMIKIFPFSPLEHQGIHLEVNLSCQVPVGKSEDRVELPQTHQFRLTVCVRLFKKKCLSILEDFWLKTRFHLSLPLVEEDMRKQVASPTSNPQKLLTKSSIYQQPQVFVKCTHQFG